MVNNKIQQKINNVMRQYVDKQYKVIPDVVRLNRHNSFSHEIAKAIIAFELMKEGKTVFTEVIFKGGGRADLFVPEDYKVIEILASETEEEFLNKTKKYPFGLDIISYKSKEVLKKIIKVV